LYHYHHLQLLPHPVRQESHRDIMKCGEINSVYENILRNSKMGIKFPIRVPYVIPRTQHCNKKDE
jgi:hypothetical protein